MSVLYKNPIVPIGTNSAETRAEHFPFEVTLNRYKFHDGYLWFEAGLRPLGVLPHSDAVFDWLRENEFGPSAVFGIEDRNRKMRRDFVRQTKLNPWGEPTRIDTSRRWVARWPEFRFRLQEDAVAFKMVWG